MFGKLFNNLKTGLTKTRNALTDKINEALNLAVTIDEDLYEELEEILIMADIGMDTTMEIIEKLKDKIRKEKINDVELVRPALKSVIAEMMKAGSENENDTNAEKEVILVIGVNGVGKTTSIGKLAAMNKAEGKKVLLAAADTFRAGAIDQLVVWSERAKVDIVKHEEGSDPAAVVFDAINASKSRGVDLLICDTAGRLHNKKNLMDELGKINRIIDRELSDANKQTLLVLDGTTGQNAVIQAKQFMEVCPIDGIVLTKLDGTAKGGVVISIKNTLKIPVKYIGVGEGIDDLQEFDAESFEIKNSQETIRLAKKECLILQTLLKHPKKIFTKEELYELVWEDSYLPGDNTLNTHLSNLRKKLNQLDPNQEYIETIWGVGVRLKGDKQ